MGILKSEKKSEIFIRSVQGFLEGLIRCVNVECLFVLCFISKQICCYLMELTIIYASWFSTYIWGRQNWLLLFFIVEINYWSTILLTWYILFNIFQSFWCLFSFFRFLLINLLCNEHWLFLVLFFRFLRLLLLNLNKRKIYFLTWWRIHLAIFWKLDAKKHILGFPHKSVWFDSDHAFKFYLRSFCFLRF